MAAGPWSMSYSAMVQAYGAHRTWEAYLRAHGAPMPEDEPEEYTPAVQRMDWEAERRAVLRQARIGTALLAALAVAVVWTAFAVAVVWN